MNPRFRDSKANKKIELTGPAPILRFVLEHSMTIFKSIEFYASKLFRGKTLIASVK